MAELGRQGGKVKSAAKEKAAQEMASAAADLGSPQLRLQGALTEQSETKV